ncbi:multicopper oxidase family protein [Pseudomonadota bacterium]
MTAFDPLLVTRRQVLKYGVAGIAGAVASPAMGLTDNANRAFEISVGKNRANILSGQAMPTEVWSYNGIVPGPVLRVQQGQRIQVVAENKLEEGTTIHWHGIRLPNAMDGVPYVTQAPIAPGETFVYDFVADDAGSFWYHPHTNSMEQVARGLSGALIVEEVDPPDVDRDELWVLDDWRLTREAAIHPSFAHPHDLSHVGRLGNVVTVNGSEMEEFPLRMGERIRLRLVNVANARIFGLEIKDHNPWLVALDGHPIKPSQLDENPLILAPGMRADLILDATGSKDRRYAVIDNFYPRFCYKLLDLVYDGGTSIVGARQPPRQLSANPVPEPDLVRAEQHQIVFEGGAMGGMREANMLGRMLSIREMFERRVFWAINGKIQAPMVLGDSIDPLFILKHNRSYVLSMRNNTAWPHPIHLHGHSFRVIRRNGKGVSAPPLRDEVLLMPKDEVDVAFVANNPGDWMFHCHVLAHQKSGMMGVIRIESV